MGDVTVLNPFMTRGSLMLMLGKNAKRICDIQAAADIAQEMAEGDSKVTTTKGANPRTKMRMGRRHCKVPS